MKLLNKRQYSTQIIHPDQNGNPIKSVLTGGIPSLSNKINKLKETLKDDQKLWYIAIPAYHQYLIIVARNENDVKEIFNKGYNGSKNTLYTIFNANEWLEYKTKYPAEPICILQ